MPAADLEVERRLCSEFDRSPADLDGHVHAGSELEEFTLDITDHLGEGLLETVIQVLFREPVDFGMTGEWRALDRRFQGRDHGSGARSQEDRSTRERTT